MHRRIIAVVIFVLIGLQPTFAQDTLADLALSDSGRLERLFGELNLDAPALSDVREAASHQNWTAACEALLEYYKHVENPAFPTPTDKPARNNAAIARADAVLNDTFTFYDQTATVPRRPDGGLQWDFTGPENDKEWAWALNRHFHLDWLLQAYEMTGDSKYAAAWDASVRDWILQNPYAEPNQNPLVWRGLETFFRVRAWAHGFYALQDEPAFTPATRILLLSSVPDHARYLRNFHQQTGNWITMELNGLATAGVAWPEFRGADAWVDYSVQRLTKELNAQVYPDGAQMELTSSYHRVTLVNFQSISDLLKPAKFPLPEAFPKTIENMWNYLAYTLRPSGYSPLNNDSDLDLNGPRLAAQAKTFKRPDWAYIASNGTEGIQTGGAPIPRLPLGGATGHAQWLGPRRAMGLLDACPMGIGTTTTTSYIYPCPPSAGTFSLMADATPMSAATGAGTSPGPPATM